MSNPTVYFPNRKKISTLPEENSDGGTLVKGVVFFVILLFCAGGIILARNNYKPTEPTTEAKENTRVILHPIEEPTPTPKDIQTLKDTITAIIAQHEGNYSVRFEDIKSSASFGINDEEVVDAASVNKIPILAALYHTVDAGEIDLEKEITIAPGDVQAYGTGSIYTRKPPHVYTIRELAKLMMEVSDNTAAFVLSNRVVGRANVQSFVNDFGLTNTDITENTTTNKDQAVLMRAMFEEKVANEELTEEMTGWLDDSIFEDRLPSQIPEEVHVYHKIGNQVRVIHDVGVIEFDDQQYYLGVLTEDIPNEDETKQVIGEISKVVYEFVKLK